MNFVINDFDGPLDLLLHLIKESKMDIMNIEIEKITQQYMDFLDKSEKMNLEIASEYLVMATELLEIKSKMLLPRNTDDEELEEDDPREELVNRLLEYQTYKEITKVLKEKESIRSELYTKLPESINNYVSDDVHITADVSLDDLLQAFQRYLERRKSERPLKTKVTVKEITVSSRCHDIKQILRKKGKVSFFELFPVINKEYIIATFLAILEMAKAKELMIIQDNNFDDILVEVMEQ